MELFRAARRIVVKVGSSTLTHDTGRLNLRRMEKLAQVLSDIKNAGKEVILVTSGAIAVGVGKLKLPSRPHDIGGRQACAAVGQCELMAIYDRLFAQFGHVTAQVLLTRDCVDDRERERNVENAFERLLDMGALPIINENDTVAVEEIEFGDNDTLSAVVAKVVRANALVILTDTDGLYTSDPRLGQGAQLIHQVDEITDHTREIAGGAGTSRGTGGMITKVTAAELATGSGIVTAILNGNDPDNLYQLFDGGEVGTVFMPAGLS